MTKAEAIRQARAKVGEVHWNGNRWQFRYLVPYLDCSLTHRGFPKRKVEKERATTLLRWAIRLLGGSENHGWYQAAEYRCYGGDWRKYVSVQRKKVLDNT